jgi:hypothetical protein
MKMMRCRNILAVLVFLTVCVSAGAQQITFSAWGRGVVTPFAATGDSSAVSAATFTSSDTPSIGFSANGVSPSGKIGFKLDLSYGEDTGGKKTIGIGDNAKVWMKPFDIFTLTAGFFKEEELRGKIGASEFAAWVLPNSGKSEDNIFQRFDAFAGAHFKIDPIKWLDSPWNGLTIQGAFGSNAPGQPGNNVRAILNLFNNEDNNTIAEDSKPNFEDERKMSALDVFKAMQIALGYRIPDIGLARVQFIGNNRDVFRYGEINNNSGGVIDVQKKLITGMNVNRDADIIEVAFLYDGMEGLRVDFGAKIPLEYTTDRNFVIFPRVIGSDGNVYNEITNSNDIRAEYTVQQPYVLAIGASWVPNFLKALSLTARADFSFGGSVRNEGNVEVENGFNLNAWLMPSYGITEYVTVGLDVGLDVHGMDKLEINGQSEKEIKPRTNPSQYLDFGLGLWAQLNLGGGRVKTGVVMMVPGTDRYNYNSSERTYIYTPRFKAEPVFSVPIAFTYSF